MFLRLFFLSFFDRLLLSKHYFLWLAMKDFLVVLGSMVPLDKDDILLGLQERVDKLSKYSRCIQRSLKSSYCILWSAYLLVRSKVVFLIASEVTQPSISPRVFLVWFLFLLPICSRDI